MDALTSHTLAVLAAGLDVRDRLRSDDPPRLESARGQLVELLHTGPPGGHPEYAPPAPFPVPIRYPGFLGVRYALTCWLDELFIDDPESPWRERWKEQAVEPQLYGGGQERAWRFWNQAVLARNNQSGEAAEAYLWCVMLGFRGDPAALEVTEPVDPAQWAAAAREKALAGREAGDRLPDPLPFPTRVPPLAGRAARRSAGRLLLVTAAAAVLTGVIAATVTLNR